ncbi:hypothetical protein N2152v2_008652 [Parachlorella kessleri]
MELPTGAAGENKDEVMQLADWRCPGCRGICTCSAENCTRAKRGWAKTGQLSHEARRQGYASTAHYLVLNHLEPKAAEALGSGGWSGDSGPLHRLALPESGAALRRKRNGPKSQREEQRMVSLALRELQALAADMGADHEGSLPELFPPSVLRDLVPLAAGNRAGAAAAAQLPDRSLGEDGHEPSGSRFELAELMARDLNAGADIGDDDAEEESRQCMGLPQDFAQRCARQVAADKRQFSQPADSTSRPPAAMDPLQQPGLLQFRTQSASEPAASAAADGAQSCRIVGSTASEGQDNKRKREQLENMLRPEDALVASSSLNQTKASLGSAATGQPQASAASLPSPPQPPAQLAALAPKLLPGPLAKPLGHCTENVSGPSTSRAQPDALEWTGLYKGVAGTLAEHQGMWYRANGGDDIGTLALLYHESHEHCISQLRAAMRKAEHMLRWLDEPLVLRGHDREGGRHHFGCDFLFTHAGLRSCLRVYCLLARVLEPADVQSYVVRRMLCQDPFVDFERSDVPARYAVLKSWLQLAFSLHESGLPEGDALAAVAQGLTCVARDLGQANQLLEKLDKFEPPVHGFSIGHWTFDEGQKLDESSQSLSLAILCWLNMLLHRVVRLLLGILQGSIPEHLACEFELPQAVPQALALRACGMLSKDLIVVLLSPALRLGSAAVRKDALRLLRTAMDCAGNTDAAPNITAAMLQQQRTARAQLAEIVKEVAVPCLEAAVSQEFSFWRWQSGTSGIASVVTDAGDGSDCRELYGYEKVEALAHCYGFLVASGNMRWEQVEAALGRPYAFAYFWQIASSLYRIMTVAMRAPQVLREPQSCASVLRLWVSALLDRGGRLAAQQLTLVLASNAATAALFTGIQPEELGFVGEDSTGVMRALLLATLVRNLVTRPAWCRQLGPVLGDLPQVLQARSNEIRSSCSRRGEALVLWQVATSAMLLSMLKEVPLHGPGRPSTAVDAATASKLKSLLGCVVDWALKSCPLALGSSSATEAGLHGQAAQQAGPELRGRLRANLKVTVFGQLGDVWQQLLVWGAPAQLDSDKALLQPLWTVVASCIEMCSGTLEPSPQEQVILELLAQSFLPLSAKQQPQQQAAATPAPVVHPLCTYVLSTFVRRNLSRAWHQHSSNQRGAVVALRFVEALLNEPSMRSADATLAVLRPLLRQLLLLLEPAQSAAAFEASLPVREQLYGLLAHLLKSSPERAALLQPASSPSVQPHTKDSQHQAAVVPQQEQQLLAAVRSFFQHAAQDVLQCVEAAVRFGGAEQQLIGEMLKQVKPKGACIAPLTLPEKKQWAKAGNQLIPVSKLHPLDAVEQLYNQHGEGLLRGAAAGASVPAEQGLFRPGDFLWTVAQRGLQFVGSLASSGSDPALALACFPVLHYLILGTRKHGATLQKSYVVLREELQQALGPEVLRPWAINERADASSRALAARQVPQPLLVHPQPNQDRQLEQRGMPSQPQAQSGPTASAAYTGGGSDANPPSQPSLSLAGTASSSHGTSQNRCTAAVYSSDQCIYKLRTLDVGAELPVTALLQTGTSALKEQANRGVSLLLELQDYSGPDGTAQSCRVEVQKAELKQRLLKDVPSGDLRHHPVVLRLTHLRLYDRTTQGVALLKCSSRTTIEVQPVSGTADALRSRARQGADQRYSVVRQQQQQPAGQASPPSPSVDSVRQAVPPFQRGMHALGSAPTVAYHHSQTQAGIGMSQHATQGTKRPAPATAAAQQGRDVKRRYGEDVSVLCSQAGPSGAAACQGQQHAAPQATQPTAKPTASQSVASLVRPEDGMDPAKLAQLKHLNAIIGQLMSQGHSKDTAKWALAKVPGRTQLAVQEAVRLAGGHLQLVQRVVRQLEGMGYGKDEAEGAAKRVWRQDLPASQLVRLAVECLLAKP